MSKVKVNQEQADILVREDSNEKHNTVKRYMVIIKWGSYETSEVLFDEYIEADDYYNKFQDVGEAVYLTKIIKEDDIR